MIIVGVSRWDKDKIEEILWVFSVDLLGMWSERGYEFCVYWVWLSICIWFADKRD